MKAAALEQYLNKCVTVYCVNYFYAGKLISIENDTATFEQGHIIYNTGDHGAKTYSCVKSFPGTWHVNIDAIESFGQFKSV